MQKTVDFLHIVYNNRFAAIAKTGLIIPGIIMLRFMKRLAIG